MKKVAKFSSLKFLILLSVLFAGSELYAQYGYGSGYGYGSRGGYGYGRQRSSIPQAQETQKEPEPKTAEELVDGEMPRITEALGLNEFEQAVLSSVLKKYVQERIEAQILKLPPEKMREVYDNITKRQDEELKAGLPLEKYEAFVALQKDGVSKTLKKKKKKTKRKKPKN
ncbi:hypothetical protein Q2T41_19570 [Maribacter confluentis]|uniref:Uncharacterized protein n=2 Tax=Maribacter TaxID=252356 RepID=A0ABT8RU90_9FLAO|nr:MULTISPECIES: hypothetical protein [Maribacter]MDO1514395.1 hypothetical protein [Maribacter confluentis]MDO1514835.1 hypothetical protein [Maribacter confluentis]TVZ13904.1 hypothetical protein JM81_0099 [Maribacter sp. MAR_2009_72]SNR65563.1 hypothetical protein SAMN04488009_3013 [Maribacter sedimenticola]